MIIGTAGHIDHGKTSLIKLLTGVDTDRLPEEKKRGITIDLGFAYTKGLGNEIIGFVDVPGHEKFVHTMVAGAVGINYGLLVIAADDGIMPQTIEHIRILELLDVSNICIAISKIDRVDQIRLSEVQKQILNLLLPTRYQNAPIFRVSNLNKEGIDDLKNYLFKLKDLEKKQGQFFRLAIDRVFISRGMGVTITGAVHAGSVKLGDQLVIMPEGLPVKVKSIHAQNQNVQESSLGTRCGIVLSGVSIEQVKRGQWLTGKELTQEVDRFDAWIEMPNDAQKSIRDGETLLLHHGTDYTSVRTILLNQKDLMPGQTALVQFVLQKKLSMCWNDPFILRDMSARYSLAGGKVLDINPPMRGRKNPERIDFLNRLKAENPSQVMQQILELSTVPVSLDFWSRAMNQSLIALRDATDAQNRHEIIVENEVFQINRHLYEQFKDKVLNLLSLQEQAIGINAIRGFFKPSIDLKLMKILLADLLANKKIFLIGSKYSLSNAGSTFSANEKVIWDKVVLFLEKDHFNPSQIEIIAREMNISEPLLQNIFSKAIAQELLVYVGNHVYYSYASIKKIAQIVDTLFQESGQISLTALKDCLQIGRNRVVLIIETFDKMGFTHRIIRKNPQTNQVSDFRIIKNKDVFLKD